MHSAWGGFVDSSVRGCGQSSGLSTYVSCCILGLVNKGCGFTHSFAQTFLLFIHSFLQTFTSVMWQLLLTINRTYNYNNNLNKPILLPGGCV